MARTVGRAMREFFLSAMPALSLSLLCLPAPLAHAAPAKKPAAAKAPSAKYVTTVYDPKLDAPLQSDDILFVALRRRFVLPPSKPGQSPEVSSAHGDLIPTVYAPADKAGCRVIFEKSYATPEGAIKRVNPLADTQEKLYLVSENGPGRIVFLSAPGSWNDHGPPVEKVVCTDPQLATAKKKFSVRDIQRAFGSAAAALPGNPQMAKLIAQFRAAFQKRPAEPPAHCPERPTVVATAEARPLTNQQVTAVQAKIEPMIELKKKMAANDEEFWPLREKYKELKAELDEMDRTASPEDRKRFDLQLDVEKAFQRMQAVNNKNDALSVEYEKREEELNAEFPGHQKEISDMIDDAVDQ